MCRLGEQLFEHDLEYTVSHFRVSRGRYSRLSKRDVGRTGCQVRNMWTSAVRQAALQIRTGFPSQVGAGVTMSR